MKTRKDSVLGPSLECFHSRGFYRPWPLGSIGRRFRWVRDLDHPGTSLGPPSEIAARRAAIFLQKKKPKVIWPETLAETWRR
jgi:hypothetical protein